MNRIRLWSLLLSALLLLACVPTPEQEYVVNKADLVVEQRLAASDAQGNGEETQPVLQRFPVHWAENPYAVNERMTVSIDAELITKTDGRYPVYRIKERTFTAEEAAQYLQTLLPLPVEVRPCRLTKDDWKREFEAWKQEIEAKEAWIAAGRPDDGMDRDESDLDPKWIEEETAWYAKQIQDAPDALDAVSASDYRGLQFGDPVVYTLEGGRTALIWVSEGTVQISLDCLRDGYLYSEGWYAHEQKYNAESPTVAAWQPVTVVREDADAMLQAVLEKLNMTDFVPRLVQQANLYDFIGSKPSARATGWVYDLVRDYGGYPTATAQFEPSQMLEYSTEEDRFVSNAPIQEETLRIMIGKDGLQAFSYSGPKTVVGLESPNVELLPFDRAKERIKQAIALTAPVLYLENQDLQYEMRVYRILLTTYLNRVRDSEEYYEMPCYVLFYDRDLRSRSDPAFYDSIYTEEYWAQQRSDPVLTQSCLIVNAVDGSVVLTDYTA